ncbi:MAG: SUMF1/EgtB/PvdO family nonheme iron enzyme [Kiritimatiellae bacterium]|nr:SUMF1/EgtB/PvdO family nonheme iron enzyme [Kiritimatiellia bacterium]
MIITMCTLARLVMAEGGAFGEQPPAGARVSLSNEWTLVETEQSLSLRWVEECQFWIGKYEITNKEYRKFAPKHDSGTFRGHSLNEDQQPVVNVTWNEVWAYCRWLNEQYRDRLPLGYVFRLPTAAEWEQCAQCGNRRQPQYPWGNVWPPPSNWNYQGEEGAFEGLPRIDNHNDGFPVACPVGVSGVNHWNLHGIGDNVAEWCYGGRRDLPRRYKPIMGASWKDARGNRLSMGWAMYMGANRSLPWVGFRVALGQQIDGKNRPLTSDKGR